MNYLKRIWEWIKIHKLATLGIVIGIIVLGFLVSVSLVSLGGARYPRSRYSIERGAPLNFEKGVPATSFSEARGKGVSVTPSPEAGKVEVKEGSMEIKSKDAEKDSEKLKLIAEESEGYVERSSKRVTNLYLSVNMTLKVPPERFLDLIEKLKKEFNVDSYNIENYRISVEREIDELEIIKKSLGDYEGIREEIKNMSVSKEKIELLMTVTDKELELKSKEKQFQREISAKERLGEFATLNVVIKEQRVAKIWPENILNRFKDRLKTAFDNTIEILRNTVGGSIEVFFKVIQIIVYLFIIGIPLAITWRVVEILYKKFWRR